MQEAWFEVVQDLSVSVLNTDIVMSMQQSQRDNSETQQSRAPHHSQTEVGYTNTPFE